MSELGQSVTLFFSPVSSISTDSLNVRINPRHKPLPVRNDYTCLVSGSASLVPQKQPYNWTLSGRVL
jgi:hypothetical protein